MAASRSRSSRSRSSSSRLKKASPALAQARAPWIRNGIDYGPARAAIHDLAAWALDLAERAVDDWPLGQEHVINTRQFLLGTIAGTRSRPASVEDLLFTASLLARIFDDELGLSLSDALAVLDLLDLPIDDVPMSSRPRVPRAPLQRSMAPAIAMRTPAPPPLRYCDDCGVIHEVGDHLARRNAA